MDPQEKAEIPVVLRTHDSPADVIDRAEEKHDLK
jgi:hypothetical protein